MLATSSRRSSSSTHAVWSYVRFTLSCPDVEDLLAERGLDVSYEARRLRQGRARPTGHRHLDEMAVRIAGKQMHLWRAVDSQGEVLDVLVQRRRAKAAARKLMRKLLRKQGFAPAEITTDRLRSYGAAFATWAWWHAGAGPAQEQPGRGVAPATPPAGAQIAAVLPPASAQRFVSVHSAVYKAFKVRRDPISRRALRASRTAAAAQWRAATA
jgi:putative transposase